MGWRNQVLRISLVLQCQFLSIVHRYGNAKLKKEATFLMCQPRLGQQDNFTHCESCIVGSVGARF